MKIQSLKLVYFSPTGTTKAVVQGIARGIDQSNVELIDITLPDARKQSLQTSEHDLLIIGVPVYMGRVPALCTEWLHAVNAHNTPVVCVVVYGNRAYEDALIELKDTLTQCGCKPIAGAACIGKHSFANDEPPTASDRPDAGDLHHAESFGRKIQEKLNTKTRTIKLGYAQRAAAHCGSATDVAEAVACGEAAVRAALAGQSGYMVKLVRDGNEPYRCSTGLQDLKDIANVEHVVPRDWISADGYLPNENFIQYARPLIEGEVKVPSEAGLPKYVTLEKSPVEKKLPPRG